MPYKFTGKERDNESGLDNFGARFYSSQFARFVSTDPIVFSARQLGNPQRLNRYTYVLNNPLIYVDPDGKDEKGLAGQFFDIFFVRASVGVGIGVKVRVLGAKLTGQASMQSTGKCPWLVMDPSLLFAKLESV